jgi:hypothetical protein
MWEYQVMNPIINPEVEALHCPATWFWFAEDVGWRFWMYITTLPSLQPPTLFLIRHHPVYKFPSSELYSDAFFIFIFLSDPDYFRHEMRSEI